MCASLTVTSLVSKYLLLHRTGLLFLKKLKCFLNNLISHHEKLLLFYPIFFLFFSFFSTLPFLFVKTSLLWKTSFPRKSFLHKKVLPPSFLKKTLCPIKFLLIFPCIEKQKSLFWELLLFFILPKPINPYLFSFFSMYSFIIYVNEITSK